MKKIKQYLSVFLVFVMAFVLWQPLTVKASVTRDLTLYVGESLSFTTFSNVKSASSSDNKVVKVSASKKDKMYTDILAKSTGKSTVKIKTDRETVNFKITVKPLDMRVKLVAVSDGYVTFSIDNQTKQTFDKIALTYSLKESKDSVVKEDTEIVYDILAKNKSYATVYVGSSQAELINKSVSTVKVSAVAHDPGEVYTDVSDSVKATVKNEKDKENSVEFNVAVKNSTNYNVEGCYYVKIYNSKNKLIGVDRCSIYLSRKSTNTYTSGYISKYSYPEYDHFEIVVNAYYTEKAQGW